MGAKDNRINILRKNILNHAHLTIDISTRLWGQHEHFDPGLCGNGFDAFANRDIIVKLCRRGHICDAKCVILR